MADVRKYLLYAFSDIFEYHYHLDNKNTPHLLLTLLKDVKTPQMVQSSTLKS